MSAREDEEAAVEEEGAGLGLTVILGAHLLQLLRRVEAGEPADWVFAELWANAEHIDRDEE